MFFLIAAGARSGEGVRNGAQRRRVRIVRGVERRRRKREKGGVGRKCGWRRSSRGTRTMRLLVLCLISRSRLPLLRKSK